LTIIERVLHSAFVPVDVAAIEAERDAVRVEFNNLTRAITAGGDEIPALVTMLKDREKRLKALENRLQPRDEPNREMRRAALEQRATEWRVLLRSHTRQARMVLQQVMMGPLTVQFEVDEAARPANRPRWFGYPRPAGFLAGIDLVCGVASRVGFEPTSSTLKGLRDRPLH
jgi:hypothetical protein